MKAINTNPLGRSQTLKAEFFDRDPRRVARALLGKVLIRRTPEGILAGRIVETEAYLSKDDGASHTAVGQTARNSVLFGPPGIAYVYFIYGVHYCLNVSCLPDGVPGGVLFRALEPIVGIADMAAARGIEIGREIDRSKIERSNTDRSEKDRSKKDPGEKDPGIPTLKKITSGPGRMAEAFDITRTRDNGKSLVDPRSDLRIVDDGYRVRKVTVTTRIGIVKSAGQPLRFLVAGNPFVSGPRL
jgi:DNA-3-methyladenine glycosylase